MKLVLVRHGRPDEENPHRPHDPPLRADGLRQAQAVAALLGRERVTRIVASPLLRARETAEPLSRQLGLPIEVVDGWAEADRHLDRYRSTETLRALGEADWSRFLRDPVGFLGGDTQRFRQDVLGAFEALRRGAGPEANVVVFTHGLPINLVLSHVLGLDGLVNFPPHYGSVTRLLAPETGRASIISINETGHYRVPAAHHGSAPA